MNKQIKVSPFVVLSDNNKKISAVENSTIGSQLKYIRTNNNLTLEKVSELTGLASSTLSKIENEQISPTFTVMKKLAQGLNVELPQLFTKPKTLPAIGRRDITLFGQGKAHATSAYEHEILSTQLSNKKMIPYKTQVKARSFHDLGEWIKHEGEEFLLVLEGKIQLLTEFYEPLTLTKGDNVYYDAMMGHLAISVSEKDAEILCLTAG